MSVSQYMQVSNFEQRLIAKAEHFDKFLEMYDREHPMVYRDRIAREAYPLFNGLSQKTNIWHPGLGPQAGISDWTDIQISRVGDGADAGYNACLINPQTYGFSVETKEYTGKNTEWRSPTICVKDTMWTEEAARQVGYIYGMGLMITSRAWEVYSREMYMQFASDNNKLYVMTEGDFLNDNPKFSYNPYETYTRETEFGATEKFTVLKLDAGVEVSSFNMSYMELLQAYLEADCPQAALTNDGGLRTYGLMIHLQDVHRALKGDNDIRQDLRYAKPQMLFDNYTQTYKTLYGWGFIHDIEQMRFKYWKIGDDGKLWFRRVLPMREGRTLTIGRMPEANPEYQTAELAIAVPFLKDVYKTRIPPKVDSLSGKTSFGPAPGFSGDWQWINYPSDQNPLREIGYHYMRMAAFPAPLRNSIYALAVLYRRCPQTWPSVCDIGTADQATSGAVNLAEAAVAGDLDADNETVTVKLTELLPEGTTVGTQVVLTEATSSQEINATIVEDANGPTYVLGFSSTEYAKVTLANLTAAATVEVKAWV